jgi:hypothetical protein
VVIARFDSKLGKLVMSGENLSASHKNGRSCWFIQFCEEPDSLTVKKLRGIGYICSRGSADDRVPFPWVELSTVACNQAGLVVLLGNAALTEGVRKVVPISSRGEGNTMARQMELFEWI